MKRSRIKVAAVAAILALDGVGLANDALAWGRFYGSHMRIADTICMLSAKPMTMTDE